MLPIDVDELQNDVDEPLIGVDAPLILFDTIPNVIDEPRSPIATLRAGTPCPSHHPEPVDGTLVR